MEVGDDAKEVCGSAGLLQSTLGNMVLALDVPQLLDEQQSLDNRVTFLVNIWLGHKPMGIRPLPASIIESSLCSDHPVYTDFSVESPAPASLQAPRASACAAMARANVPFGYFGHALEFAVDVEAAKQVAGSTFEASALLQARLTHAVREPHARKRPRNG